MNEADKFLQEHLAKAQRNAQSSSPARPTVQVRQRQQVQTPTSHAYTAQFTPKPQYAHETVVGQQQMVSMAEAFKRFWTNWTLDGRSSRSEVWFWILSCVLIWFLMGFICGMLNMSVVLVVLQILWSIVTLWPSFALTVRRLHDLGKSATFAVVWHVGYLVLAIFQGVGARDEVIGILGLLILIPAIMMLCFMLRPSEPHENQYGPVPNVR